MGCLHMTIQTAVLIEVLWPGAKCRWSSCNIYSTKITPLQQLKWNLFSLGRMSEEEFWWCIDQAIEAEG